MFNVGGAEILVLLVIALMVLGPERLPQAGRQLGKMVADFKRATSGVRREIEESMSIGDLRKEVDDLRSAFDLKKLMADGVAGAAASPSTPPTVVSAPDGSPVAIAPTTPPTPIGAPTVSPVRDVLAD